LVSAACGAGVVFSGKRFAHRGASPVRSPAKAKIEKHFCRKDAQSSQRNSKLSHGFFLRFLRLFAAIFFVFVVKIFERTFCREIT
jgi:hypothetical protein